MKTLSIVLLPLLFIFLIGSCTPPEPTFQEKIETAIITHFNVESVDDTKVIDSVKVEKVNENISILNDLISQQNQAVIDIPAEIDSAKVNLKKAEESLENMTEMLVVFVEENIEDWKRIIKQKEENLIANKSQLTKNKAEVEFYNSTLPGNKGIAYYQVVSNIEGEELQMAISSNFKVIRVYD